MKRAQSIFRRKSLDQLLSQADNLSDVHSHHGLKKSLGVRDLTALGIAAVVGAGIFSTIGTAAGNGGPAAALLFIFIAVACSFSALCYAQFASVVPLSGSAYTYAYVTFGEIIAWIIGWDLLLEYAIGNVAVAISWSDYFTHTFDLAFKSMDIHFPYWLSMDYYSAHYAYEVHENIRIAQESRPIVTHAYDAYMNSPSILGFKLIFDLPAVVITILITALVYIGIRETKRASNAMVLLKVGVIILVISVGAFYISTDNWDPFIPEGGLKKVMTGVSAVFFAFIGFDAISTTAEECKDPQRDLPRGILYSLVICTILYVLITLVLTGMVPHASLLGIGDPMAYVFAQKDIAWMSWVVGISAVVAMASVLLVFQMGQPRIWMAMSRDGLLPKRFSKVHPKFRTPSFATVIAGIVVIVPLFFFNINEVADFTSIGTLFAFVLVSGGVLVMDMNGQSKNAKFKVPYINGRFIVPALLVGGLAAVAYFDSPDTLSNLFVFDFSSKQASAVSYGNIPVLFFLLVCVVLSVMAVKHKLSLIPILGMLSCLYLMTELNHVIWARFFIWLGIGLLVYVIYSHRNSHLAKAQQSQ